MLQGIGKAYAKALAKRGLNVVIISRTADRLAATAEEIRAAAPKALVKTIQADFSQSVESGLYERIKSACRVGFDNCITSYCTLGSCYSFK